MSQGQQFKSKEEYELDAKRLNVVFEVETYEGPIPLDQRGTQEELQAALISIGKDGLTLPNQDGFVWYPVTSIRKVIVKSR